MPASSEQINRICALVRELQGLVDRSFPEIMRALLQTNTLRRLGQTGDGRLDSEQADACIRLLERWIGQAKRK